MTGRAGPNGRGTSIGPAPRSESSATARLGASLAIVAGLAVGVVAAVVLRAERRLGAEPSSVLNALSESLGHRIDAQEVDISYWPPGIVATSVTVSDESPFGPGSLLRADELELRASPWALLRGRLVMDEVRLVRPAARLVRGEDGRWNTESSQPRPQARTPRAPGRGTAAEVEIETVRVRGGRIRYRDRALPSAAEVEVDDVNLLFTRDEGLALDFNASALGGGPESVVGSLRWPSPGPGTDVEVELRGSSLEAARVPELLAPLQIPVPSPLDLAGRLDLEIHGSVGPMWPASRGQVELHVRGREAAISAAHGWLTKPVGVPAEITLELERGGGGWWVQKALFATKGIALTARVDTLSGAPGSTRNDDGAQPPLRFSAESIRAEDLAAWMPTLAALAPTGEVFLEGRFETTPGGPAADVNLTGGPLELRGGAQSAAITRLAVRLRAEPDLLRARGTLDEIRVGEIRAETVQGDIEGDPDAKLRVLVNAVALGRSDASLEGVTLAGEVGDGRIDFPWVDVAGFGGTLVGRAAAVRLDGDYVATFEPRWQDVDAPALLRLLGSDDRIEGILSGRATLLARASGWDELASGLSGSFELHLADGAIEDVNPGRALLAELERLPGLRSAVERRVAEIAPELLATSAEGVSVYAQGKILDRRIDVDSLAVGARAYELDAAGDVSFGGEVELDGTVALTPGIQAKLVPNAPLFGIVAPRRHGPLAVPLSIRGTYPQLTTDARAPEPAEAAPEPPGSLLDRLLGGRP